MKHTKATFTVTLPVDVFEGSEELTTGAIVTLLNIVTEKVHANGVTGFYENITGGEGGRFILQANDPNHGRLKLPPVSGASDHTIPAAKNYRIYLEETGEELVTRYLRSPQTQTTARPIQTHYVVLYAGEYRRLCVRVTDQPYRDTGKPTHYFVMPDGVEMGVRFEKVKPATLGELEKADPDVFKNPQ